MTDSISDLRISLSSIEAAFTLALDNGDGAAAHQFYMEREAVWNKLVIEIQRDDPYTTEADIRYFEEN